MVLGGDGMLGHELIRQWRERHEIAAVFRRDQDAYAGLDLTASKAYYGIDAVNINRLMQVVADFKPGAVVNGIGLVKQRDSAKSPIPSLEINALFPHRLAVLCEAANARLVHMSTDCVFSGRQGPYGEDHPSDALDLYGRSKFLGEVNHPGAITLRTSIIGLELSRHTGLVAWFLRQRGEVKGFTRALYTGFTTMEMARIIERILMEYSELNGVWQAAAPEIDKYSLLRKIAERLPEYDVHVVPDDSFYCDRRLNGQRLNSALGYEPPAWDTMLDELTEEIRSRNR